MIWSFPPSLAIKRGNTLAAPTGSSACRRRWARLRDKRGMTLIEIMIVLVLMALLIGTMAFGSGFFGGANRRAAATLIVAGVRKGLAQANTTGKPARLAIDLTQGQVVLEQASSSQALVGGKKDEDETTEPLDPAAVLLQQAEASAEEILSGGGKHDPGFAPVAVFGDDGEGPGRALGSGIKVLKVQTEHDEEPITEGVAYIYFWPGGVTERAIVQIAKLGDDTGLTVEISPLTGRADIKRGLLDLPDSVFDEDEDYSERDEL